MGEAPGRSVEEDVVERANVLIVEDNEEVAEQLTAALTERGWRCLHAATLGMARLLTPRHDFALVLLDVMLPDGSGLDLLRELRAESAVPVIVLTARDMGVDKVAALDWGADDYITKPFWIEELLARVRAVERRARPEAGATTVLEVEDLRADLDALALTIADEEVALTPTQWALMRALARRPGRPLRRGALLEVLPGEAVSEDALHAQISRLRKRLGGHGWRLETVWGIGYRFVWTGGREEGE